MKIKMTVQFPIWLKLFTVSLILILLATIPTAIKNYSRLRLESVDREWQFITTQSEAKTTEVNLLIKSIIDKAMVSAGYLLEAKLNEDREGTLNLNPFEKDPDLVSIEIIRVDGSKNEVILRESKKEILHEYGLREDYFQLVRSVQGFPWNRVAEGKIEIRNATQLVPAPDKAFGVVTIGFPFSKDAKGSIEKIVLVDVHLAAFQKPFNKKNENILFLADSRGFTLAHENQDLAIDRENLISNPLIHFALSHPLQTQYQHRYTLTNAQGIQSTYIGSYMRTAYGPLVVIQTPLQEVLAPAEMVKFEFIKNLCYTLFFSIFLITLFALTLTSPIEKLASLIKRVAQGDFDIQAQAQVTSRDEVGQLAEAFDEMTVGLKERDKVKNLFSKFHGSSIAEDIINNEIKLGGQSKQVVVFFSDIRGFTAFSEKKSPEEVVEMLNEYFSVMVKIINQYGGVVDKFIGDAIMAIWGAPKSTGLDAKNAVRACLEMRKSLADLNEKRIARGQTPLQIGMGLHAGLAVSGAIGSSERMEYTVIGNTVNTASRIEA